MAELPLIDASGLTQTQREGLACVSCRKRFPKPTVPVGRLASGDVLYRCPECLVTLEPVDTGQSQELTTKSDSDQRG